VQFASAHPRVDEIPFESEHRFMATLHHDHAGHSAVLLKGAPERVLDLCTQDGGGQPLDRDAWEGRMHAAAGAGQRVLALARCQMPADTTALAMDDITPRFTLLGLVGLIDPPREEAIAAVAECQRAGLRVKMITGDHAVTAAAIGRQLGLNARPRPDRRHGRKRSTTRRSGAAPSIPTSLRAPARSTSCAWWPRCRPRANWWP
jgi:magnesium-transporting ATPase (P-type)